MIGGNYCVEVEDYPHEDRELACLIVLYDAQSKCVEEFLPCVSLYLVTAECELDEVIGIPLKKGIVSRYDCFFLFNPFIFI